jgi:hypothetical protein
MTQERFQFISMDFHYETGILIRDGLKENEIALIALIGLIVWCSFYFYFRFKAATLARRTNSVTKGNNGIKLLCRIHVTGEKLQI